MTKRFLMAALLGIATLTAVAVAHPQPPATGKDNQGSGDTKPKLPAIDPKILTDTKTALATADLLEAAYEGKQPPEAVRMLLAILRGPQLGPNDGWFGPAQTRYDWQWLAKAHGVDPDKGAITQKMFRGSEALFARLDRDMDGQLTAADLDWSGNTGKFKSKGGAKRPESMKAVLIRGLFNGEIGSINEGPHVGQPAPNFTLRTADGKGKVQLADHIGKKPVVLVFGNYTCSPFCKAYTGIEPIYERFKKDATFLLVYVREAHPADGWSAGFDIKQPKTFEERLTVAETFCKKLTPSLPVLVDEINDPVGHAYSGMPSRLYVIDSQGTVVFKNGRGPFGFRPAEMEQALAMTLLDATLQKQPPAK